MIKKNPMRNATATKTGCVKKPTMKGKLTPKTTKPIIMIIIVTKCPKIKLVVLSLIPISSPTFQA